MSDELSSRGVGVEEEFIAAISHDLRTPLNAILGWASLLRDDALDLNTRERALDAILRNARVQAQIIDALLDTASIVSGKLKIERSPVEIVPIVQAAVEAHRAQADAKGLGVVTMLDALAGSVSGEPKRLQQIIEHLVVNAIKFTPSGGLLEIRLERANGSVAIVVKDTGVGISPQALAHVFDGLSGRSDHSAGLGLGLVIVRHLAELHGGTVHVESAGEGQGATFVVRLPRASVRMADSPMKNPTIRIPDNPDLRGARVLVVDDEPDARELVEAVLAESGCEVRIAGSTAEALRLIEQWIPDVLVADIGMPGEDGYELIRKTRAMERRAGFRLAAVALTAYASAEDRERAIAAGFKMHVSKPVEPARLLKVVAQLVEIQRQESGAASAKLS